MAGSIVNKMKMSDCLPSPNGVALKLIQLSKNPHTTLGDMVAAVETDPAMAVQVLKLANSPVS